MNPTSITPETLVSDLLDRWPAVAPIFVRHQMNCVGCTMSKFETLASAAEIYHLSLPQFIDELADCISSVER